MRKTEKIIAGLLTMAFGVLFILLKGEMVSALMTVLGVALVVFGVMDLIAKNVVAGVVKLVLAALVILFGWVFVHAVLYLLGAALLVVGILALYELIKKRVSFCSRDLKSWLVYLKPVVCMLIGLLLFFNGFDWIFVLVGTVTVIEGGILFFDAIRGD